MDKKPAIDGEIWMKCQAMQTLVGGTGPRDMREIEEWFRLHTAIGIHDPDHSLELDDEDPSTSIIRNGDIDRARQVSRDLHKLDLRITGKVTTQMGWSGFGGRRYGRGVLGLTRADLTNQRNYMQKRDQVGAQTKNWRHELPPKHEPTLIHSRNESRSSTIM